MELVIQMLWLACGLAAVPVLAVLGRMYLQSVRGARWARSELRPWEAGICLDVTKTLAKADAVLGVSGA